MFPINPTNGEIRTHADGRKWEFASTKGVWKIKQTVVDEADYIGAAGVDGTQGIQGIQGIQGPVGPAAATYSVSGTTLNITT